MCFAIIMMIFERRISLRILSDAVERGLLSQTNWLIIAFCSSMSIIWPFSVLRSSVSAFILIILAQIIGIRLIVATLVRRRLKIAEFEVCGFVNEIIVEMRAGSGFQTAFSTASCHQSDFLKYQLSLLGQSFLNARLSVNLPSKFLQQAFQEIFEAHQVAHNAISRLMALRHRIRVMSDFRRKSGQATAQVRAQVLLMVGLYIATVLFMAFQIGLETIKMELSVSGMLFLMGGIWMYRIGRRHKWKI